jgi:16S rRNA (guanine(966)-N(2))-methyltransferase RsmD
MSLRVIAGSAKGRHLKRVPGDTTRPVMDRVKEALFNILGEAVTDALFLDLYAGTGGVGIEALSRGAASAVFVEQDRFAAKIIEENLQTTDFTELGQIIRADVRDFIRRPASASYEIVYIAPPQYRGLWRETLLLLDKNPEHVALDGIVVVQIDPVEKTDLTLNVLRPFDERRYGNTLLWFFERPSE